MKFWILLACSIFLSGCSNKIDLTTDERVYIQSTIVMVGIEENYYPYIYIDDSKVQGLSNNYLELISGKTGLRFINKSQCLVTECFTELNNGKINLVTSVRSTLSRSDVALFTRPYFITSGVIIQQNATPKSVGIVEGYAISEFLPIYAPHMNIVEYDNNEKAIAALIAGDIKSVALDAVSARKLRLRYHFDFDEKSIPYDYPFSLAVEKTNPLLLTILDKAISAITPIEHQRIFDKWK